MGRGTDNEDPVASLAQSLALRFGADADELAQATRVAAWRHLGDVRAPLAWARRVALNALRQDRRAAGRRGEHEARAAADRSSERGPLPPDEILGAIEVRRLVLDAIESLPTDAPAPEPEVQDPAARVAMGAPAPATEAAPAAPAPSVTGQVVDLAGRGVSGARIVVSGSEGSEGAPVSRAGGTFDWPVRDRQVRLTAQLDGHVAVLEATLQEDAKGTPLIVLAPAIRIAGRTEDGSGDPLPDASLRIDLPETWSADLGRNLAGGRAFSLRGRSGADGAFGPWTVPAVPGTLIWASGPVHTDLFLCPEVDRLDLVLTIDEDDVSMIPMVTCTVTRDGAEPVQGARVALHEWHEETDERGMVDIPRALLAEAPSFLALERGHVPHRVLPPTPDGPARCEVVPAATLALHRVRREVVWPERIEIRLPREPLPGIAGRVVDEDGLPHGGVRVWLDVDLLDTDEDSLFGDALGSVSTRSGDDGAFHLPGLPGRGYTVLARSDESLAAARLDDVLAGGGQVTLTVGRRGPPGMIEGTCRAPDGTALPGVEVTALFDMGPHSYRYLKEAPPTTTDERGRFSFTALPAVPSHFSWKGRSVVPDQRAWDTTPAPGGERWNAEVDLEVHRRADVVFDRSGVEGDVWWITLSREDGTPVFMNVYEWLPEHQIEGVAGTLWGEFDEGRTPVYTVPEGRLVARLVGEGDRVFAERRFTLTAGEAEPRVIDF